MEIILDNTKCPSWNKVYAGVHWTTRKKDVDAIHELMHWAVYKAKNKPVLPFIDQIDVEVVVSYKDERRHDPDNCYIKPFIDGLVKSGVLKDDSSRFIKKLTIEVLTGQPSDQILIKLK